MATVLLTQPGPRVTGIAKQIEAAGITARRLSFSQLTPLPGGARKLTDCLSHSYDRVIFVSPSAVWFARDQLAALASACDGAIAVIGAGTEASLLAQAGDLISTDKIIRPSQSPFDADALLVEPAMRADALQSILVIRGLQGRDDWIDSYRKQAVSVTVACLYERQSLTPQDQEVTALERLAQSDQPTLVLVTSVAHAGQLCAWSTGKPFESWLRQQPCMVSHPRIAQKLTDGGFQVMVPAPGDNSMAVGAIQWWQRQSMR
ncbi:MAG: uroporphyrinogen-III synthase [Burkholderiaceae bacterium]